MTYHDPASGIEVDVEVRTLAGFDAADWVMRVRNTSGRVSPRIEGIRSAALASVEPVKIVHDGRSCQPNFGSRLPLR